MGLFTPQTTIYLCADTGIDDANKAYFESNTAIAGWLMGKVKKSFTQYSYQRGDERSYATLEIDYYDALACDVVMWKNAGFSDMWIIANITGVEFVNPNTTRVYFKIDAYSTFCGAIKWQDCYVEREHVENDWNGGAPNWDNIGIPEQIDGAPVVVSDQTFYDFSPNKFVVISPYDATGKPTFNGTVQNGVYSGMNMVVLSSKEEVDSYLEGVADNVEAELSSVVGVLSVNEQMLSPEPIYLGEVSPPWVTESGKYNNAKTFSSQYCIFAIESLAAQRKTFLPELMFAGDMTTGVTAICNIIGGKGGIIAYPSYYKGVTNNYEESFILTDLPQGAWVGDNVADNAASILTGPIGTILSSFAILAGGALTGGTGLVIGGAAGMIGGGASLVANTFSAYKQSAISGGQYSAPANLACGVNNYGIRLRWYTSTETIMKAVDSYFDRFGYNVNAIKKPNVNTRPKWNYVKTSEGHVGGDMPANFRHDIEKMLNDGVTFWNVSAVQIGDFSDPAGNKG